jgi:hypothetical protein
LLIQFIHMAGQPDDPKVDAMEIVSAFNPIRVNASGGAYTDAQGRSWSADFGFSGGNTWTVSSSIANA